METLHPLNIDLISDEVIAVTWSDDHESIYFADHLRKNCPCAICAGKEEEQQAGPFKVIKTALKDIQFTSWNMVGRYAVNFGFNDGHKTGIYTYETLRHLCQCDQCADDMIRIQGPLK